MKRSYIKCPFCGPSPPHLRPIVKRLYPTEEELQATADFPSRGPESVFRLFEKQGIPSSVAIRIKRRHSQKKIEGEKKITDIILEVKSV